VNACKAALGVKETAGGKVCDTKAIGGYCTEIVYVNSCPEFKGTPSPTLTALTTVGRAGDGNDVGVIVAVALALGLGLGLGVLVALALGLGLGVIVAVALGLGLGVLVALGLGLGVRDGLGLGLANDPLRVYMYVIVYVLSTCSIITGRFA